jgi:hypothetical protein
VRLCRLLVVFATAACAPTPEDTVSRDRAVWRAVVERVCPDVNGPCARAIARPWGMPGLKNVDLPIVTTARQLQKEYQLEESHLARFLPGCPGPYACSAPSRQQDTLPVPTSQASGARPVSLELSQIAYSTDGRTALVGVHVSIFPLGGHEDIAVVRRFRNGSWNVMNVAGVVVE